MTERLKKKTRNRKNNFCVPSYIELSAAKVNESGQCISQTNTSIFMICRYSDILTHTSARLNRFASSENQEKALECDFKETKRFKASL